MDGAFFTRSEAVLGRAAMARLAAARVLVVGVGGVGSWCAEALVRTGVGSVTLVDDDRIAASNVNRQCPALAASVGRPKVSEMRARLLAVNPAADVVAVPARYAPGGCAGVDLLSFDYIVDAIDSVDCKAALILAASEARVPLASSMGAALRTDPTRVRVTDFAKVSGDGLARALRQRFKRLGRRPGRFACAWSEEPPLRLETRGSLMGVTATFGMCLASEAIRTLAAERPETRAVVAFGSNLDPRRDYLEQALARVGAFPATRLLAASAIEETEPLGVPDEFRALRFLNRVAVFATRLGARAFSDRLHEVEDALGRVRTVRNGPRTIDVDLIDFGGIRSTDPTLTLPHPRARERDFVWRPWQELLESEPCRRFDAGERDADI